MDKNWKQRNKKYFRTSKNKMYTSYEVCNHLCEKRGRITYLIYIFAFINKDLFAPRERNCIPEEEHQKTSYYNQSEALIL